VNAWHAVNDNAAHADKLVLLSAQWQAEWSVARIGCMQTACLGSATSTKNAGQDCASAVRTALYVLCVQSMY
jgi:hypothetical protein